MDWDATWERVRLEQGAARGHRLRPKPFRVQYRAFAGLRSVIYDRGDHFEARLSELVREAPEAVRLSLARILIGNLDRRLRATPQERQPYDAWSRSPEMLARHDELRGTRGRKRMLPPEGRVHDLRRIFLRLNAEYFDGRLSEPRLGWSRSVSRSLYGHHDAAHDAIVLNRKLDHPRVPEAVVADILHHEMLHIVHGVRLLPTGRRVMHPRAFKQDERRFAHHAEAQRFLRDLETRRIRLRPVDPSPPAAAPPPRGLWGFGLRLLGGPAKP